MALTKQQKLDGLGTRVSATGDFHIEPFPKLSDYTSYGYKQGAEMFSEACERWRITLEQAINKRLTSAAVIATVSV